MTNGWKPSGPMVPSAAVLERMGPAAREETLDSLALREFTDRMRIKLERARANGRGGWHEPDSCGPAGKPTIQQELSEMLREHVDKGDPVDVANIAMMLSMRGERIL